ncbi:hypothetical protein CARUB_v100039352mg, partial [Capsella rubella]
AKIIDYNHHLLVHIVNRFIHPIPADTGLQ